MSQQGNGKNGLLLKILVPVLIVVAVTAIWFVKNQAMPAIFQESTTPVSAQTTQTPTAESEIVTNTPISATSTPNAQNMETKATQPDSVSIDNTLSISVVELATWKEYGLPILIDFGADSCIPCKEMAPVLKKLNEEWNGKVLIKFVDVWKNTTASNDFPLQVIPTQFIFTPDGKPYVPSDSVEIEFQMYQMKDTGEHVYTAHQGGLTEAQIRAIMKDMGVE